LLPLLCDVVPLELQEQALYVMLNATSLKDSAVLSLACQQGVVQAVQGAAATARTGGYEDALAVAYSVLTNLAESCSEGRKQFVASADGTALLLSLFDDASALSAEGRSAAANLLLALCSAEPSRQAMTRAGCRRSLEAIASWDTERTLAARAKQALRELM